MEGGTTLSALHFSLHCGLLLDNLGAGGHPLSQIAQKVENFWTSALQPPNLNWLKTIISPIRPFPLKQMKKFMKNLWSWKQNELFFLYSIFFDELWSWSRAKICDLQLLFKIRRNEAVSWHFCVRGIFPPKVQCKSKILKNISIFNFCLWTLPQKMPPTQKCQETASFLLILKTSYKSEFLSRDQNQTSSKKF